MIIIFYRQLCKLLGSSQFSPYASLQCAWSSVTLCCITRPLLAIWSQNNRAVWSTMKKTTCTHGWIGVRLENNTLYIVGKKKTKPNWRERLLYAKTKSSLRYCIVFLLPIIYRLVELVNNFLTATSLHFKDEITTLTAPIGSELLAKQLKLLQDGSCCSWQFEWEYDHLHRRLYTQLQPFNAIKSS